MSNVSPGFISSWFLISTGITNWNFVQTFIFVSKLPKKHFFSKSFFKIFFSSFSGREAKLSLFSESSLKITNAIFSILQILKIFHISIFKSSLHSKGRIICHFGQTDATEYIFKDSLFIIFYKYVKVYFLKSM